MNDEEIWNLVRSQEWHVVKNDLIGGWIVANCNIAPSKMDWGKRQIGVADFMSEESAHHIASLHNDWLELHRRGTI